MQDALADPGRGGGGTRDVTLGLILFTFMQFSIKILSTNRFSSQTHRLTPSLGNPGSATGIHPF